MSIKTAYTKLDLHPEVKKVLAELKKEEAQSNGRFGALGKRVPFKEKTIAVFPKLKTETHTHRGITTESEFVVFSDPILSKSEPLILKIAKQEKDLN